MQKIIISSKMTPRKAFIQWNTFTVLLTSKLSRNLQSSSSVCFWHNSSSFHTEEESESRGWYERFSTGNTKRNYKSRAMVRVWEEVKQLLATGHTDVSLLSVICDVERKAKDTSGKRKERRPRKVAKSTQRELKPLCRKYVYQIRSC